MLSVLVDLTSLFVVDFITFIIIKYSPKTFYIFRFDLIAYYLVFWLENVNFFDFFAKKQIPLSDCQLLFLSLSF